LLQLRGWVLEIIKEMHVLFGLNSHNLSLGPRF